MSETYRTVVTNGKKNTNKTNREQFQNIEKKLAPPYTHTRFGVRFCGTFLSGWNVEGARAAESRRVRGPPRTRGQSRERARRRSSKSPRAWGEPCFSVHHTVQSASLFPARASCRSGLRRFGETPARAHDPSLSSCSRPIQLIIRRT